jgi:hypothetical protein
MDEGRLRVESNALAVERRQRQAHYAAIVGAVVTAGSMVFGVLTYQRSTFQQKQAGSLGILHDYLTLAVEHPDLASRRPDQPINAEYEWFVTNAMFTAETLWTLVGDDPRWSSSISSILRQHRHYLEQGVFVCDDFSQEFVTYIKSRIPGLKCAR